MIPKQSTRPTQKRLRILYFVRPFRRGRWFAGASVKVYPLMATRVGKNRCIPAKSGKCVTQARLKALVEQPTSLTVFPVTQFRKRLALREEIFRTRLSSRFFRYPLTMSAFPEATISTNRGISNGSFWPSPSSVAKISPLPAWMPAHRAADCPAFFSNERKR